MMCSFGSLKESVVNISYSTTNKTFQVLEDPFGLESPFNGMYKFLAPCHILISPKPRVHTRVEPIDLVFLNYVIQCFYNIYQRTITEFVNLIKPHDLSFIVTDREHNCMRRLNDGVVVLVLKAFCIPSRFSEIQLFLVALNADFRVDVVKDFKEDMLKDYYCWLKTYCCWFWLKLLDNAAVQIVSVVQIVSAASIIVNIVSSKLLTPYISLRDKDLQKSKDPHVVVSAAKLPILNPNEFYLWKMRIEQYFLMTDYSLWEARGTLLMALPDKHQLKFNIHKDDKSLIEAIEKRFGGNKETKKRNKTDLEDQSLDDLFNNLKIYETEVKSSSSTSPTTQNITFVSSQNTDSTNESVSVVTSVSAASTKVPIFALPNVDNLSDAMAMLTMRAKRFLHNTERNLRANGTTFIGFDMSKVECYNCHRRGHFARKCRSTKDTRNKETQRRNVLMETSTSNALVLQCDGIGSYDWSFQADEEPTNYALMVFTSSSSSSSDNEVATCSKACSKAYATFQSHYDKLTNNLRKSQFDVLSYKTVLEYVEARIVVYQQNKHVFEEDIKFLKLDVMLRENALVELRKKFKKAEQERDDSGSNVSMPTSPVHDRPSVKPVEHPIPAKNLRKDILTSRGHRHSWNRKACFVCKSLTHLIKDCNYYEKKMVHKPVRNHAIRGHHQRYARMTHPHPHRHVVPTTVITRSRLVPLTATRPVTTAVPQTKVQHQRPTKHGIPKVNVVQGVKGNWVWKPKCPVLDHVSRHTSASMTLKQFDYTNALGRSKKISFLSDFEEINRGYVAFGGNPKGGKITRKGDLTCLFVKATLYESNLWHRRLGHINFKTMNKLVKGNLVRGLPSKVFKNNHTCVACKKGKQHRASRKSKPVSSISQPFQRVLVTKPYNKTPYELLLGRTHSIGFMRPFDCHVTILNTLDPLGCRPTWLFDIDTLTQSMNYQPVVAGNQPNSRAVKETESEVHVSPSSSAKTKKHDDKTKREAKGKSHVELSTGVRNLSEEFEDFSSNNTNGVNAASTPVTAVGPNSTNNTNTFSVAGLSHNAVSSNFELGGKSSYVDPSQYPDNPDMPALEDITYSDDEEDVGAEADFSNLETNITNNPIPTTRVHKDHHVTQIIGDLSLAPQTRSMTRMVKEQVARIEAIRLFLAYASFMDFMVYQMDVKSAFLYGTIEEEVYVYQPLGFEDPDYPDKVYKVVKSLYGLHQAPRAWYETLANYLLENDGKSASSPIDTMKLLLKDPNVKRIFRYLKGKTHLGLWYPKDSPLNLVAYSDSDYARASLDRKSTTGGCQFLERLKADNTVRVNQIVTIFLIKSSIHIPGPKLISRISIFTVNTFISLGCSGKFSRKMRKTL
nr:putative ribonuclease H-like domain-containing protein [Tanacetum cinerariifolium]